MGAGFGLNIAGTAVRAAGIDGQFGTELLGAWGNYFGAKLGAKMEHFQADALRRSAEGLLSEASSYTETAGKVQRAGEEEAVNRYLRLGQDIGRIYAGAAGGNIDVTSGTVGKVDAAARLMAQRDVEAINRTAADQANAYVARAASTRREHANAISEAAMMDIDAKYRSKIAKGVFRSQIVSAAGNWLGGHAQNAASMFGG